MSGFLLDTNVVSELTGSAPDSQVMAFLAEQHDLWLSAMVVHELAFGLQLLPHGQRRDVLRAVLSGFITDYQDRILPVDRMGAEWAAYFQCAGASIRTGTGPGGCAHCRNCQGS